MSGRQSTLNPSFILQVPLLELSEACGRSKPNLEDSLLILVIMMVRLNLPVDEVGHCHCYKTTAEHQEQDHPLISRSVYDLVLTRVESLTILEYL